MWFILGLCVFLVLPILLAITHIANYDMPNAQMKRAWRDAHEENDKRDSHAAYVKAKAEELEAEAAWRDTAKFKTLESIRNQTIGWCVGLLAFGWFLQSGVLWFVPVVLVIGVVAYVVTAFTK